MQKESQEMKNGYDTPGEGASGKNVKGNRENRETWRKKKKKTRGRQ